MTRRLLGLAVLTGVLLAGAWWYYRTPEPTVLSFRVGQTFEEVVRNSTYPVMEHSSIPTHAYLGSGETFVTEPAVVLCFDDPKHGFTLPPTKFAMIGYDENHVATVSTSPMLEKLPFDDAVAVLENLQNQFKAGGWEPWKVDGSVWFDLSPEGRKRLYARMFEPGYMQTAILHVPKKYGMTFRLKCAEGCWTGEPPYKFLIDVGVSDDTEGREPGDPDVWDKTFPAPAATAQSRCPGRHSGAGR
jgi:hypothetical protein